jgi:transcriptional regulator with XRE-family HTH domain
MATNDVLSRNVRRFREDQGLSIGAVVRRSGLSKQTLITIESGQGNPTVKTLESLAECFGVSIRTLLAELGTETLIDWGDAVRWRTQGAMQVRQLDQAFGSGYVYNTVLRFQLNQNVTRLDASSRGSLRHCFVLEGRVRIGPESASVDVSADDFVRFPADGVHIFEAITPIATVFVCTTAPQLSMAGGERYF